ncbi:MAG: tetratricopeptide repeat protein [Nitrospirota bacterium]
MSTQFSKIKRFNAIKCSNAVCVLTKEIDRGKNLPEFFYLRGKAYMLLSLNKKASADFEKACSLKPASIKYKKTFAVSLLLSEEYQKCLEVIENSPKTPSFMLIKGACLYKSGKPADAIGVLDSYLARAPWDGAGHYQKARCLMALGRFGEAQVSFRKSLRLGGDAVESLTWLALSVMAQDKKEGELAGGIPLAA